MLKTLLFATLAAVAVMPAQSPGPVAQDDAPAIKVDVNVVSILASVRDKKGGLVGNLQKDDFIVLEDGKPQEIKYFTRESELPLTIGLLVDVSRSQENLIGDERQAATEFFGQVLRKKDLAFLISFGEEAELMQDFTGSPKLLDAALGELRVRGSTAGGLNPGPVPTMSQPRGTVLHDAVFLAADEKLKTEVGRKVLVVISDGIDQGSRLSRDQAIEAAQKADAVIYSIEYYDPREYGGFGTFAGGSSLKRMSEETGGRVFRVDRNHSLSQIFRELQEEMRSQYMIGYTPTNSVRDDSYRKLEVKTTRKDLKVQARKGYYAVKQ
jgi:VWFA-related protein